MDPDYLPFCANPTRPKFKAPPGAVDAHCHVFGPAATFPYAPERKYTPCDAPKEKLFALRDFLGFSRNVIVQGSCHGKDNRAMLDALVNSSGKARGVAVVGSAITPAELKDMHEKGVRGVRFNFVKRLVDVPPLEELSHIGKRVADLGWHIVVYFEARDLADLTPFFKSLPTKIIVDHMGRPDVTKGTDDAQFQSFVRLLRDNEKFWTKVNGEERITVQGPPYDDVIPFSRLLVETFPDRVLWGTDWPHPNMKSHMPDDGVLTDSIPKFASTASLRQKLLVDNPQRLYWSD
ncbi:MAG TPA: amidohydrolase family protein [Rhizomicrobium sp.]|nr:amidohydrolase family protein [Rhizomicrobium sp.]